MTNLAYKLAFLFSLTICCSTNSSSQNKNKTVIFVCEHGGARSTIAALYFNNMAKENHLPYSAVFRGITPDSTITKETRNGLITDGFQTNSLTPVALATNDCNPNTLLVSLDCSVPPGYRTFHEWTGIPAISTDYQAARNEIVKHLNQLILELKEQK